ncbi:MAG: sigma-54 dependent transcriptional regulator [Thermodesulfobacteriota bacterium]|nr:sigma-54 dependent transcriptional regulator [Thermodesulfobacteriota bacterium]
MEIEDIQKQSIKMQQVYNMILNLAPTDVTVLIQGEDGTEKEWVAEAIHAHSSRRDKAFVVINCAAYPRSLLDDELFGYEKRISKGASHHKKGRLERADGGTAFLNDIDEVLPLSQVKLLKFLETMEFERPGGRGKVRVNVRMITAADKDLKEEVEKGTFNEELYYRLSIINIYIPPLRQRKEDIPFWVEYFMERLSGEGKGVIKKITPKAMQFLMDYSWPGNVKELENTIQYAYLTTRDELIDQDDLIPRLRNEVTREEGKGVISFEDNEKRFLLKMLREENWNKLQVAKKLKISRSTLYAKLKKYNLVSKPSSVAEV